MTLSVGDTIPSITLTKATPDGHTLLMAPGALATARIDQLSRKSLQVGLEAGGNLQSRGLHLKKALAIEM